jgi:hypothetical protein
MALFASFGGEGFGGSEVDGKIEKSHFFLSVFIE